MSDFERALATILGKDPVPEWTEVERLMTDGYARVLALEAERLRVMRELVDLAGSAKTADRAAALTSELDGIGLELTGLRESLNAVRRRFARQGDLVPRPATG
jgi:2-oxo-4-hydroxy-4-carboxy--5-ureidoimidazoline (OHCU) decarboxylase